MSTHRMKSEMVEGKEGEGKGENKEEEEEETGTHLYQPNLYKE